MIRTLGLILCVCIGMTSCDSSRIYEDFKELPSGWSISDTVNFAVALDAGQNTYQFTSQFRCDVTYQYSNLYYYFQVRNTRDSLLYDALEEVQFFDQKTGRPLGSGLGDLYHVEDLVMADFNNGGLDSVRVSMIQYMRLDTLQGIDRIGLRVNTQESD